MDKCKKPIDPRTIANIAMVFFGGFVIGRRVGLGRGYGRGLRDALLLERRPHNGSK